MRIHSATLVSSLQWNGFAQFIRSIHTSGGNDCNHCAHTYAISDVYFAEVCVVSHVCRNRARLFSLEVGELFECDIDEGAFRELRELLSG